MVGNDSEQTAEDRRVSGMHNKCGAGTDGQIRD
jgi:hypothetical protein